MGTHYSLFDKAGTQCGYCFLSNDNKEERKSYKSYVKEILKSLSNICTNTQQGIIEEALKICNNCDYKNPNVFHFLERKKIGALIT